MTIKTIRPDLLSAILQSTHNMGGAYPNRSKRKEFSPPVGERGQGKAQWIVTQKTRTHYGEMSTYGMPRNSYKINYSGELTR
jgi:hypothetical protein